MSVHREYDIAFVGLKPGQHEYSYDIEESFFASYPAQEFSGIQAKVRLVLEKNPSFLMLRFEVGGTAGVNCDRCGNPLTVQLWDDFEVLVKLADDPERMNEEEEDPDVRYISRGESIINVEEWIYEFITLSIPTHCQCGDDAAGKSQCNQKALEVLKKMENVKTKDVKDIWKGLDKFKNL